MSREGGHIRRRRWPLLLLAAALGWLSPGRPAHAQLISPGKLSAPHADLDGITRCTSCHNLGERGIDNDKCLQCHQPLGTRLEQGRGFHATVRDQHCSGCHKEHFGLDFEIVRFDTAAFDHSVTGFGLVASHRTVPCRGCHAPGRITDAEVRAFKGQHGALPETFLGLSDACRSCHGQESPHAGQFEGRGCQDCHNEGSWDDPMRFDHAGTAFPLTGLHRDVSCESCHQAAAPRSGNAPYVQYEGVASGSCATCHEDPHAGAREGRCETCHATAGWQSINRASFERVFDHDEAGFELLGAHRRTACAGCHGKPAPRTAEVRIRFVPGTTGSMYPHPDVQDCVSCHVDYHRGVFTDTPGGLVCANCHTQDAWLPADYGLERHNGEAAFALTGAHLATPCIACHDGRAQDDGRPRFHFEALACASCHGDDSPHGGQFADAGGTAACEGCHTTEAWQLDDAFDHGTTAFTLTGVHAGLACASCHTAALDPSGQRVRRYRGLGVACASCHAPDDPHRGQFEGASCDGCHDTESYHVTGFDHGATRFPLDGAHASVACVACHTTERDEEGAPFIRFKPLPTACADCHTAPR